MRTLAIDTSHAAGTVAAVAGERVAVRPLGASGEHAAVLAQRLTEVADELGFRLAEAEVVCVVRGPGSFTGLRVGVATAKGIVWAGGGRLVGLSGFELVAWETARIAGWNDAALQIAFDAGRGDVSAAQVSPDRARPGGWLAGQASLQPAAEWIGGLTAGSRVSGPAATIHAAAIEAAGHHLAPPAGWFPTAFAAAAVGRLRAAAGEADDPATLVPDYLRPSYADERRSAGS